MTDMQKWQLLALGVLLIALAYWLQPVLTPFVAAAMLAYVGDPLVTRLTRWKMSRGLAVAVVFGVMSLALLLAVIILVPMIERQVLRLIANLPAYFLWLRGHAEPYLAGFGLDLSEWNGDRLRELLLGHWKEAGGVAAQVLSVASTSGWALLHGLAVVLMVPVVAFYLMRDWPEMLQRIDELLPRPVAPTVERLARESDSVLGAFLRGQLLIMLVLAVFYCVGLWAVGIDLALLIGLGAGLVSFVPYLGAAVGVGAGVIAAAVQHHDLLHVALVLGVFWIGHLLESWVLAPVLVGDRIGLHPVAVLFALFCGAELFGFLGVLLALPTAAVIMVMLRHAHERYVRSGLYAAERPPDLTQAAVPPLVGEQAVSVPTAEPPLP